MNSELHGGRMRMSKRLLAAMLGLPKDTEIVFVFDESQQMGFFADMGAISVLMKHPDLPAVREDGSVKDVEAVMETVDGTTRFKEWTVLS